MYTPKRPGLNFRQRQRQSQRQRMAWIAAGSSALILVIVVLFQQTLRSTETKAAVSGDYRSKSSGQWKLKTTWETYTGSAWIDASSAPNSSTGAVTIRTGHTVTVNSAESADQLDIETGATLDITNNTLNIANGSGVDLLNNGTLQVGSTLNLAAGASIENNLLITNTNTITLGAGASISHLSGSEYRHQRNGGTIPASTWNTGSTCTISGVTTALPTQLIQSYHHFTWSSGSQSATLSFGAPVTFGGNFNLASTGSGTLQAGGNVVVSGQYNQSGGTFVFIPSGSTTASTMAVAGNCSITGGSFDLSAGNVKGTLLLSGDFSHTSGLLHESGSGGAEVRFTAAGNQVYASGGSVNNAVDYRVVSGSRLVMNAATTTFTGAGSFTLENNAGMLMRSASGITQTASSGHVLVTGSRNYNTGAEYIYAGSTTQNCGNGLPATVRRLECNNSQGLNLISDITVTGELALTSGTVNVGNQLITLGIDNANPGIYTRTSGHVEGTMLRWLPVNSTSLVFPLGFGNDYRGMTVRFQQANSTGALRVRFQNGFPGTYGLPLNDAGDVCSTIASGWWTVSAEQGHQTGTFGIDVCGNGFSGITDASTLHLIRRDDATAAWTAQGSHSASTGTASQPIIIRDNLVQPGQFAVSSGGVNPLPVNLIRLELKEVGGDAVLSWATASEVNSDYFRVERSADGTDFIPVESIPAAGNSTSVRAYSLRDTDPLPGRSYYRLVQVDRDGRTETFGPKAFHLNDANETIRQMLVFPNPATGPVDVRFHSIRNTKARLQVVDEKGAGVFMVSLEVKSGLNTYMLETSAWKSGSYVVVVDDGTHALRTRLVKP
ncbi:MAG: T9SS type A sorting domain-containing protein [Sphingobacteriales bacterium]|nr:T9SS type A sorting domain-containing protein [Sphingobacteriales bacterium]